jgi:DNA-binding IclR family transcriptional regulator
MSRRTRDWTFLTNHAAVLISVAREPELRIRDIAERVGITERAAHSILSDLADEGYLTIIKDGRRNSYKVHPETAMRHPMARGHQIGEVMAVLGRSD